MLSDYCNTITTVKITLIAPRVITEWLSTWGPVSFSTELDCRCLLEPTHIFMMGPLRKRINKYNIYKQFLGWGVSLAGRDSPIWETHQCRRPGFDPGIRKIPWRRKWLPTPVFWPGKSHEQRSLVGYSPQGCKESDTTEWLHFHFLWHLTVALAGQTMETTCRAQCKMKMQSPLFKN